MPHWNAPDALHGIDAPKWRQALLKGKSHRPLRRTFLLARQGLFLTPPLHASLTGSPDKAFTFATACPQCQGNPAFPAHVFFECPLFTHLRVDFERDVIYHAASLLAPSWSTVQDVEPAWRHLMARFGPHLREATRPLPSHNKPAAPTVGPEPYDPRTDPEVLANGMSLADTKARARAAPDLRLPRSIKDWAKKAIRALRAPGDARKPKPDVTEETRAKMTLATAPGPLMPRNTTPTPSSRPGWW